MRKLICAATVEAAVASARRDLGEDALLVDVQLASEEKGESGGYRVLFEADPASLGRADRTVPSARPSVPGAARIHLEDLKDELARLSTLVACLASAGTGRGRHPQLTCLTAMLQAYDLPADWTQTILGRVERRLHPEDREARASLAVAEELRSSVLFSGDAASGAGRSIIALVGPPGAGKTSTLVKLAMRIGIARRRRALVMSADSCRLAAADQLQAYARVLGLPFLSVDSPSGLRSGLLDHCQKDLVLLDTPGYGPGDWASAEELAEILRSINGLKVQLVLPATTRAQDLRELVRRWAIFRPDQLIFTRIDETVSYGGCVAAALDAGRPIAWLGTGQEIPEDLELASPERLFGGFLAQELDAMAAVA